MVRLESPRPQNRPYSELLDLQASVGPGNRCDPHGTWVGGSVPQPQKIGSYRILHPIAEGSMGEVFRAVNEATNETVALKLVQSSSRPLFENHRTFFLREMSILSRLHHPRIVGVRDFGLADGQLFMAMEYIKTIDLASELAQCSPSQQVRVVCGIGCYMLEGLHHAHLQNIIHRDIKPANVLVYRNAEQGNKIGIKIADFGVSKDFRLAGLSGMTNDGDVRGTPAFMSPEQLLNSRDATPACDIYSTAAVLYYYLSGMVPHQESRREPVKLCRIIEGAKIPLASRRPDLPLELCQVIDRGLARVDSGRYQTASEFNRALIRFTRKQRKVVE